MKQNYLLSVAAMFAIQQKANPYLTAPHIAKNQAPIKKNGGRPMFKQNRRAQMRANR